MLIWTLEKNLKKPKKNIKKKGSTGKNAPSAKGSKTPTADPKQGSTAEGQVVTSSDPDQTQSNAESQPPSNTTETSTAIEEKEAHKLRQEINRLKANANSKDLKIKGLVETVAI